MASIVFLTIYSLLPEGAVGDRLFFQMQGIVALIVTFLCAFLLKEPQYSHEENEIEMITPGVAVSKRQN